MQSARREREREKDSEMKMKCLKAQAVSKVRRMAGTLYTINLPTLNCRKLYRSSSTEPDEFTRVS